MNVYFLLFLVLACTFLASAAKTTTTKSVPISKMGKTGKGGKRNGTTTKPTANDADDAELAWINAKLDKAKKGETVGDGEYSRGNEYDDE